MRLQLLRLREKHPPDEWRKIVPDKAWKTGVKAARMKRDYIDLLREVRDSAGGVLIEIINLLFGLAMVILTTPIALVKWLYLWGKFFWIVQWGEWKDE